VRPLIVAAEHPSQTVGFASVATNVAAQLHDRGWPVHYLGFEPLEADDGPWPFPVEAVDGIDGVGERVADLAPLAPAVLFFGRALHLLAIDDRLRRAGRRDDVDLTFYAAIDYTPSPGSVGQLVAAVDRIVPATRFAATAIGGPLVDAIPHGVDTTRFRPLRPSQRAEVRARELGAGDELVIGYFGRNSRHKRPDLALRAFAHFARGAYATCATCGHLTVAELNSCGSFGEPTSCRLCAGSVVEPGTAHPDGRLFMHTELSDAAERRASGGFDLELLARRFGVADRVTFDRSLSVGRGVALHRLAERMAAVDLHLLLCEGGGWELTVLETGACGVPNVVTDYAGPAEYAAPFSRLIPVANQLMQPWGVEGVVDLDAAVGALVDLADVPEHRVELGAAGPATAARYRWERVGQLWHELLARVAG